jgi:hypothetical protein
MGRTAYREPQCLYKGDLYLYLISKRDKGKKIKKSSINLKPSLLFISN